MNLDLFPKIEYAHAWLRLDDEIAARVKPLRRAAERIDNAIRFTWFSDADSKTLHCAPEEDDTPIRQGFLRAALMELCSVEDVLPLDLSDIGRPERALKMYDTPLPHLHLVRELRNHEIHLRHNQLTSFSRDLVWGNLNKPEDARPLRASFWILQGVTPQSVSELRNARLYSDDEIRAMVQWFNDVQHRWGIHELMLRTITDYTAALGARFFPT